MESARLPLGLPGTLKRVVLTGFMGSGKTTVGRLLAAHLGWAFADLDDEITRRTRLGVPEVFAKHGEEHFRREESSALADCLKVSSFVLALGGGAPEADSNRELLRNCEGTVVVYLSGSFDALHARCVLQSTEPNAVPRPVLADKELARSRFAKRAPFYEEIATITVECESQTPDRLAESLADHLRAAFDLPTTAADTPDMA